VPPTRQPGSLEEIPDRIREALKHRGINQSELARRINVRAGTISTLLSGESAPSVETLTAVCQALKVYPSYIMLGLEPKYFDDSSTALAPVEPPPPQQRPAHGIDQWLSEHPEIEEDERAWLRAIPWPVAHVRQPDLVYLTVLSVYRQAREARPRTPVAGPAVARSRP